LRCNTDYQYSVATSTLMRYRMCDGSVGKGLGIDI
jgi:hypothetical protein